MRYLFIILLFPFALYGQCVKYVNGVPTPCTQAEITQFQKESARADSTAKDSTNVQKARIENRIGNRQQKLFDFYVKASLKLNKADFNNFVQSTRQERGDFPYNPDLLILWMTTTFPTKGYFDADLQTKLLNILQ